MRTATEIAQCEAAVDVANAPGTLTRPPPAPPVSGRGRSTNKLHHHPTPLPQRVRSESRLKIPRNQRAIAVSWSPGGSQDKEAGRDKAGPPRRPTEEKTMETQLPNQRKPSDALPTKPADWGTCRLSRLPLRCDESTQSILKRPTRHQQKERGKLWDRRTVPATKRSPPLLRKAVILSNQYNFNKNTLTASLRDDTDQADLKDEDDDDDEAELQRLARSAQEEGAPTSPLPAAQNPPRVRFAGEDTTDALSVNTAATRRATPDPIAKTSDTTASVVRRLRQQQRRHQQDLQDEDTVVSDRSIASAALRESILEAASSLATDKSNKRATQVMVELVNEAIAKGVTPEEIRQYPATSEVQEVAAKLIGGSIDRPTLKAAAKFAIAIAAACVDAIEEKEKPTNQEGQEIRADDDEASTISECSVDTALEGLMTPRSTAGGGSPANGTGFSPPREDEIRRLWWLLDRLVSQRASGSPLDCDLHQSLQGTRLQQVAHSPPTVLRRQRAILENNFITLGLPLPPPMRAQGWLEGNLVTPTGQDKADESGASREAGGARPPNDEVINVP